MRKVNFFSKPVLYVAAVAYIVVGFMTLAAGDRLANFLFDEDQYFESMGALGFFVTSFVLFYGLVKTFKLRPITAFSRMRQLIILGLALLFFFGGGEEISWGQRIFNVQTPTAMTAINVQNETNIHNIALFEYQIPFERLFDLFWLSLTVILPLIAMFMKPVREFIKRFFTVPHLGIGLLFLFDYSWAKLAEMLYHATYTLNTVPFVQAVQEVKESNYALLFVLVAVYTVLDIKDNMA